MKILTKVLQLRFLPLSVDFALLVLRVWIGASMLFLHGWPKLSNFEAMAAKFSGLFGLSPTATLVLAIIGEVGASILLILGLFTRFAALLGAFTMGVAFFIVHSSQLSGPSSGEMAFIYLAAYVTILFGGGGAYAFDMKLAAAHAPKSI